MRGRDGVVEEDLLEEVDEVVELYETSDELEEYRERGSKREVALERADSRRSLVVWEKREVESLKLEENEVGKVESMVSFWARG